jgi:CBS-domain-containing membrane protein
VLFVCRQAQEGASLEDVMSRQIICVTENIPLEQLSNTFKKVSGVCVVDEEKRLIGVVSRKDLSREGVSGAAPAVHQRWSGAGQAFSMCRARHRMSFVV